jgi:hypothetical protein
MPGLAIHAEHAVIGAGRWVLGKDEGTESGRMGCGDSAAVR